MTSPETELTRVLESYADDVLVTHPDLVGVVEKRYLRRAVLRHAAAAGGLAIVLVATIVGFTAIKPEPGRIALPAATPNATVAPLPSFLPFGDSGWHAPAAPLKSSASIWPEATFTVPKSAPDGAVAEGLFMRDATHIVVNSGHGSDTKHFYVYDIRTGTFTPLDVGRPGDMLFGLTSQCALLRRRSGTGFQIVKAALAGGSEQVLASISQKSAETGVLYADASAVYWSGVDPGVMTVSINGGQPHPLAGFGNMHIVDHSGWAVEYRAAERTAYQNDTSGAIFVTESLRNIATGQRVAVRAPAQAWSLSCTPSICVGQVGRPSGAGSSVTETGSMFVQSPDGAHRTALPAILGVGPSDGPGAAFGYRGRDYVVVAAHQHTVVWEPATGVAAKVIPGLGPNGVGDGLSTDDLIGNLDPNTHGYTYLALSAIQ